MAIKDTIKIELLRKYNEHGQLEDLLKSKLSEAYPNKNLIKIDMKNIMSNNLSKRLRNSKMKTLKEEQLRDIISSSNIDISLQSFVYFGFNSVFKHLKTNKLSCVLVSSNLDPNFLSFLLPLCIDKNVPVLGLDNLAHITKSTLGFCAKVIGFNTDILQDLNHFQQIGILVYDIWEQNSSSSNQENCHKKLKKMRPKVIYQASKIL